MPSIPLTVIGGYLGAGKTTLLNHVLHQNQGQRIAVLVNDFGAVNIDARLIASHDGDTISLANGCICCSLAAGFLTVLTSLLARDPRPERIIVEASGVALPHKLAQYGHLPGFRLDAVVVLVDVETIRTRARDKFVGKTVVRQLQGADLLVLTKTDLVPELQVAGVREWLRALVPGARIVVADPETISRTVLLDAGDWTPGAIAAVSPDDGTEHILEHDTWSGHHADQPLAGDAFRTMIATFPDGIVRGKGIVWLAEDPERQTIFQLVGKRWSLKPGEPWSDRQVATDVVFIGLPGSIDGPQLDRALLASSVQD